MVLPRRVLGASWAACPRLGTPSWVRDSSCGYASLKKKRSRNGLGPSLEGLEYSLGRPGLVWYKVGIEFTGWPTRPRPSPVKGPTRPDPRWLPVDMIKGQCRGDCKTQQRSEYRRTELGKYHK